MDAGSDHKEDDGKIYECYKKNDGQIAMKRKSETETLTSTIFRNISTLFKQYSFQNGTLKNHPARNNTPPSNSIPSSCMNDKQCLLYAYLKSLPIKITCWP